MSDNSTNDIQDGAPGADELIIDVEAEEAAAATSTPESDETAAQDATEAAPSPTQELEARIAALEADKTKLEEEKQDAWNRLLRATADLDNFRKRSRREIDDTRTEARTQVLKEMLPVIDNLERAVEHAVKSGNEAESGIVQGVQLVLRQFGHALERCEVLPVDAAGKPFDPNVHEAISQIETAEHPPGAIVQVLQKGYTIRDRLLRPALVVVAKAPPEPEPPETTNETAPDTGEDAPGSSSEPEGDPEGSSGSEA